MATYYRWRKSEANYELTLQYNITAGLSVLGVGPYLNNKMDIYYSDSVTLGNNTISLNNPNGPIPLGDYSSGVIDFDVYSSYGYIIFGATQSDIIYKSLDPVTSLQRSSVSAAYVKTGHIQSFYSKAGPGDFVEYVYSTNASSYPNGDVQGDYYYDQRTTITSPTAPTNLQYPNPILTSSATVSWTASVTNVPIYAVSTYEVSYSTNGGSTWTVAGTTASTSLSVDIPAGATSIQFRVRAKDSNGQWSSYATGTASTVLLSPTLTVPTLAMQGQNITVKWSAIDGATSYTLQRQANTDDDWVQVYSGNALTFTETVGTWTTVQYRVQAVFSVGPGGWGTSKVIPVVSASALVISGTDEDLGVVTNDIPYSISTDTRNQITATITVNNAVIFSGSVGNSTADVIPVLDLPTGEGTIVISASVNTSGGSPVTATRTWTYTKMAFNFPNTGSTAQLQQEGKNVFPATLAECVRVGANLGGDLGHALEMIAPSVLNGAKIETGSYTGTGTYGESNPNTLTFNIKPKVIFITSTNEKPAMVFGMLIRSMTYGQVVFPNVSSMSVSNILQWEENSISWYVSGSVGSFQPSASYQLNASGEKYLYVAFG